MPRRCILGLALFDLDRGFRLVTRFDRPLTVAEYCRRYWRE